MSEDRFSDAALCGFAIAAQMFGWTASQFWQTTPAELSQAICDPRVSERACGPGRDLINEMIERDAYG